MRHGQGLWGSGTHFRSVSGSDLVLDAVLWKPSDSRLTVYFGSPFFWLTLKATMEIVLIWTHSGPWFALIWTLLWL